MRFLPPASSPMGPSPVIKALFPSDGSADQQGAATDVTHSSQLNYGLSLGYDPYGSLHLDHSSTLKYSYTTRSTAIGSGVESSHALFTITEDPTSRQGVKVRLYEYRFSLLWKEKKEKTNYNLNRLPQPSVDFAVSSFSDPPSFYYCLLTCHINWQILLQIPPGAKSAAFEMELSVEANVGKGEVSMNLRKMLGSPRVWR
jgi:hypothetical protein